MSLISQAALKKSLILCGLAFSASLLFADLGYSQNSAAPARPNNSSSNSAAPAGRSSSMEQSQRVRFKEKTDVNFEDAHIDGQVRNPFMSGIGSREQNINNGFIKLRTNWHDQMILSVNGLSQ